MRPVNLRIMSGFRLAIPAFCLCLLIGATPVRGTVTGHPGYGYNGTSYGARTWLAIGKCDPAITSDQQDYGSCP